MSSHTALSIYVDHVVGARNQQLKLENESLQAARSFLETVHVHHGSGYVKDFNLLEFEDGEEYISLTLDEPIEFPYNKLGSLGVSVSGVGSPTEGSQISFLEQPPKLFFDNDKEIVGIAIFVPNDVAIMVGSLKNYTGTFEEMKNFVQHNQIELLAAWLGAVAIDFETREPRSSHLAIQRILQGCTILLNKIKIPKESIQKTLNILHSGRQVGNDGSWELQAVKNLAIASLHHDEGLAAILEEQLALELQNRSLKVFRDFVQTVEARCSSECNHSWTPLRWNLEDGHHGKTRDNLPTWVFLAKESYKKTSGIPLTFIPGMEFLLGGRRFCLPSGVGSRSGDASLYSEDGYVYLNFFYSTGIHAVFESLNTIDTDSIPGGLLTIVNIVSSNLAGRLDDRNPSILTMRLVELQIRMDQIQGHLDVLGIDGTQSSLEFEEQS